MIFDQLVTELHFSPFRELEWPPPEWWGFPTACPICGTLDLSQFPVPEHADPICQECWIHNRHINWREWHCADCGAFLRGLDRMALASGYTLTFLCREHFEERCSCAMTESSAHSCAIHGQNGFEL